MKKTKYLFILVALITSFSFLILLSNSECIVCTQVIPNCSTNEILIPQSCNDCAHCVTTSSTSSGCPQIATDCFGKPTGCKSRFGIYNPKNCMCVCPDSTSSSGDLIILNKNFTGIWRGKILNNSKAITLKFCIKNQRLDGTVNIPGDIENGIIVSQNIISNNEVSVTVKNESDLTKELNLKLTDKRHLQISIDGVEPFEARRINLFKSCVSSTSSSSGGTKCSSKGSCRGSNGEELPCPKGTECSGLPAYGCYPPGCPVPICCSPDTKIKTTGEQKRIADIKEGEFVLTDDGKAVRVKKVSKTPVKNHKVLKITLNDGTILEISPAHPTADGRKLKDLKMGDILDGRMVIETKLIPYTYSHTYDILPDSKSGNYYANGILIKSTLK